MHNRTVQPSPKWDDKFVDLKKIFFGRPMLPEILSVLCTVVPNTQHILDVHLVFIGFSWTLESGFNLLGLF